MLKDVNFTARGSRSTGTPPRAAPPFRRRRTPFRGRRVSPDGYIAMSVAEIRMSVRVRPTVDPCAVNLDPRTGALNLTTGDVFDYPTSVVVGSDQDVAYAELCAPLVRHALTGYDCTLVAYGQTGSGKTHTMFGPPGCLVEARVRQWRSESRGTSKSSDAPRDWGVFPRAVLELMRTPGVRSIRASAVEVYHENVFDLMNERTQLSLGSSKTKFGRRVQGATESGSDDVAARGGQGGVHPSCCTCHKCFQLQEKEKERARAERALIASTRSSSRAAPGGTRTSSSSNAATGSSSSTQTTRETFSTVGETLVPLDTPESLAIFARSVEATRTSKSHLLNDRSSRSHCLVKVHAKTGDGTRVCIMFVDLAGSERVARTGATGEAKHEAQAINGSLSALGRVVKMLGERSRGATNTRGANKVPSGHVPYRDASLTMLLRDSFGGGSCTSVVINVAGETTHVDETACSLRFGERMSVVRNEPTRVLGDANARSSRVGSPGGTKVGTLGAADLKRRLAVANGELNALELRGDGGGFVKGGPVTEIESLRRGMEKLAVMDAASAKLRVGLAEARGEQDQGGAGKIAHLRKALATSAKQAEVLRSVVERQKTIKAIWAEPTVSYARKAAEVRQIRSELEMEES